MSKKVLQKLTAITTAAIMAASAIPMTASAAWNKDANANWQWTENGSKSTGWKNIHGNWYYFNGAGVMQTGWNFVNGQWYYFNQSGSMQTGWNFVDGEWYLLGANGAMAKGWQKEGNTWYHLNENGVMSRHWRKLNDKWYHFSPSGQMSTGWVNWKDDYYFCSQDGTMQSGVVEINNKIYYFDEVTGNMKTGRIKIDGVTYNFGPDGAATGSLLPKAQKAFNTNGVATTPSIPNNGSGSNRPSGGGGGGIGDGSFVEVNNVSLDQRSARMEAGDDLILIATVSPYNATDKTVYWKSSDERIAIVNSAGLVSALKSGNVTITATAGRETATCDIEVLSGEIKATSIAVTSAGSKTEVYYDDTAANTLQLTATITPANASLQSVTWSSSSPAVAKVNDSGLVTGLTAGTATITASAKDGSGVKGTFVLTVSKKPTQIVKVTGITVTQAQSKKEVEVGSTLPLGVTVSPSNATNKGVTWTSSNSAFATVNASGVVTGVKAGSVTITATAADGSGVKGTYAVTVNAKPVQDVKVTGITVTQAASKHDIYFTENLQLNTTVVPSNATNKAVTWSSSDTTIATVDTNGLATAKSKAGTVIITATAKDGSGVRGTYSINVSKKPAEIVKVTGITVSQADNKTTVDVASALPLSATVAPSNATNKGVTWTSSNSAFATVNASGVVTGVKAGSVTITATAADGSGVRGTYAITVNAAVVAAKPTFTTNLPTAKTVAIGTELKLTVAASVTDGGKLSYQWYKGADEIANATSASYTVAKAATSDGGDYQCIVTNTKGTATASADSEVCKVTISDPKNALMGVPFTTAVGRDNFAYYSDSFDNPNFARWLTDGDAPLTGTADTSGHIMHAAPGNNDTDYTFDWGTEKTIKQITISSIAGQVWYPEDGVPDHIRIQAKVKGVWTEVFNKTGLRGTGASKKFVFGVKDNGEILATGLKFEFFPRVKPAGAVHLTEIEALVDAPASGVKQDGQMIAPDISGFAKLPVIDKDVEATKAVVVGSPWSLSVKASVSDNSTLEYQWYHGTDKIAGATAATYNVPSGKGTDKGDYHVVVTNNNGTTPAAVTGKTCKVSVSDSDNALIGLQWTTDMADSHFAFQATPTSKPQMKDWLSDGEAALTGLNELPGHVAYYASADAGKSDFTFEWDTVKDIKQINFSAVKGFIWVEEDGVPDHVTIKAKVNGEWVQVLDKQGLRGAGTSKKFVFNTEGGKAIKATGLQFVFHARVAPAFAIHLTEIEARATAPTGAVDGTMTVPSAEVAATPTFTTDLAATKEVNEGAELKLTVAASVTDAGKLSYQWYKGTDKIANATAASYTVASATAADVGSYKCVVTNTKGKATASADSKVCAVTVKAAAVAAKPTFSTNLPAAKTAIVGSKVDFTVSASVTDGGTLTYQWYKGSDVIANATSATYSIASAVKGDVGSYKVVVTNSKNGKTASTDSEICALTVTDAPVVGNSIIAGKSWASTTVVSESYGGKPFVLGSAEWLTDGKKPAPEKLSTAGMATSGVVPFYGKEAGKMQSFEYDLTAGSNTFKQIIIGTLKTYNSSSPLVTTIPQKIKLEIFAGGKWQTLFENANNYTQVDANREFVFGGDTAITGEKLRFSFLGFGDTSWPGICLNEIEVLNEAPTRATDGKLTAPTSDTAATPSFTGNLPATKDAVVGDKVDLAVVAATTDTGTLTYQWYKGLDAIVGANSATYSIAAAATTDSGDYKCVVTNTLNGQTASANSATCKLTVSEAPIASSSLLLGKVWEASDVGPHYAQANEKDINAWMTDGQYVEFSDNGRIFKRLGIGNNCFFTYNFGKTESFKQVTIDVHKFTDSKGEMDGGIPAGVRMEISPDGQKWQTIYSNSAFPDQTNPGVYKFVFASDTDISANFIRFSVTKDNARGAGIYIDEIEVLKVAPTIAVTDDMKLTMYPQTPSFTTPIAKQQTVTAGEAVTILSNAEAAPVGITQTYQWYKDDAVINGATEKDLAFATVAETDSGTYYCTVTNTNGTKSESATTGYCGFTVNGIKTNFALNASYVPSQEPNANRLDESGKDLTDGISTRSGDYKEPRYVGYEGISGATFNIVLDLGAAKVLTDVEIDTMGGAGGINHPTELKVEVSTDNLAWTNFATAAHDGSTVSDTMTATNAAGVTARYVKISVPQTNGWFFLSEIRAKGDTASIPEVAETPTISADLPATHALNVGAALNLSVTASVTDGGTLSYQWYKNNAAIADATSASYSIASVTAADQATYKVLVTNTKGNASATTESVNCAVSVADTDNVLSRLEWSTAIPDGSFAYTAVPSQNPEMKGWLTDGRAPIDGTFDQNGHVAFAGPGENAKPDFTFEWTDAKDIKQINFSAVSGTIWNAEDGCPDHVTIKARIGGVWTQIFDQVGLRGTGASKKYVFDTDGGTAISANGLQFFFHARTSPAAAIQLTEIEARSTAPTGAVDGTMKAVAPEVELHNIAKGKDYTFAYAPLAGYPDGGHELTDGVRITDTNFYNGAYVGFGFVPAETGLPGQYITLDLGTPQSFQKVVFDSMDDKSGSGLAYIANATIAYSNNNVDWTEFGKWTGPVPQGPGSVNCYVYKNEPVTAQYVRIFYAGTGLSFISEVEVMAAGAAAVAPTITTNLPSAKIVESGVNVDLKVVAEAPSDGGTLSYQWYKDGIKLANTTDTYNIPSSSVADNGSYQVVVTNTNAVGAKEWTDSALCTFSVEKPLHVISQGKSYTMETYPYSGGSAGYLDEGGVTMTDGVKSTEVSYGDPKYAAWSSGSNPGIVVDLGSLQDVNKVAFDNMSTANSGIGMIANATISYSTDNVSWTDFGKWTTPNTAAAGIQICSVYKETAVPAQYIKIDMQDAGMIFISEVEVFAAGADSAAPSFTKNLASTKTAMVGGSTSLTVQGTSDDGGDLTYQWYKDGVAIDYATSSTYSIATVSLADAGAYKCVVTNHKAGAVGSQFSSSTICTLTVKDGTNLAAGKTYAYAVGTPLTGAPDTLGTALTDGNTGDFVLDSSWVAFETAGQEIIIDLGASETFREVNIDMMERYQDTTLGNVIWYLGNAKAAYSDDQATWKDFGSYSNGGAWAYTTDIMTASIVAAPATGRYVKITLPDIYVAALSEIRVIGDGSVTPPADPATPTFSTDLNAVKAATVGDKVDLAVVAATTDAGTLTYQWYKGLDAIAGANSATYSIAAAATTDSGDYKCVVTNTLNGKTAVANSAICKLTVSEAPVTEDNLLKGAKWTNTSVTAQSIGDAAFAAGSDAKLTDGLAPKATGADAASNVTFYQATKGIPQSFTYALPAGNQTFKQIKISCADTAIWGVETGKNPSKIKIEAKIGGEWKIIFANVKSFATTPASKTFVFGADQDITATELKFSFTSTNDNSGWPGISLDEIEVRKSAASGATDGKLVVDTTETATPSITYNLQSTQLSAVGGHVDLFVAATKDAADTGTLSYQWAKDGTDIAGATKDTYTIDSAAASDNGVYTCAVINAKGSSKKSVLSNPCTLAVKAMDNIALNKTYTMLSPEGGVVAAGWGKERQTTELTNGVDSYTETAYSKAPWLGISNVKDPFSMTIDLGTPQTFEAINFDNLQSTDGISFARYASFSYSDDGINWTGIANLQNLPRHAGVGVRNISVQCASPITARYVRVQTEADHWFFVSEIRVLNTSTVTPPPAVGTKIPYAAKGTPAVSFVNGVSDKGTTKVTYAAGNFTVADDVTSFSFIDGTVLKTVTKSGSAWGEILVQDAANSLIKGDAYTVNVTPTAANNDGGHDLLTNGGIGGTNYAEGWFGSQDTSKAPEVVVTLKGETAIDTMSAYFLRDIPNGVGLPGATVQFWTSMNGTDWTKLGETALPKYEKSQASIDTNVISEAIVTGTSVNAKFVKVSLSGVDWVYLSEVAAFGAGAVTPPIGDSNVLSGMTYTTDADRNTGDSGIHMDAGGTMLTDGVRAASTGNWHSPEFAGFTKPAGTESGAPFTLTFDSFDKVKTIKELNFEFAQRTGSAIHVPETVVIEFKDAQGVWGNPTTATFTGEATADHRILSRSYTIGTPVEAYGMRMTFSVAAGWGWMFVDEIEAIGTNGAAIV